MQTKSGLKIIPHRITGGSTMDVPFRIEGHQLRWVSGAVQSLNTERPWKQLKKSDLDPKTWEMLKERFYGFFNSSHDGDTIRYGENVLSYAPLEIINQIKAEKNQLAQQQISRVMQPSNRKIKIDREETKIDRNISKEFFDKQE